MPMAYFEDWQFPASWVSGRLLSDVSRLKARRTHIKPTLDGSGTTEQNVSIIKSLQKTYPQIQSIVWFSAFYWQPQGLERIVRIHQSAAAAGR
jgi:hypothetical protein